MSIKISRYLVLAVLVVLVTVPALATVVTVTPVGDKTPAFTDGYEQQCTNGWSIATNKNGEGVMTRGGPAVYDRDVPFVTQDSTNLGTGAFSASCTYVGQDVAPNKTPSTVWLGLDQFNGAPLTGIKLKQLKTLQYYGYTSNIPPRMDGNSDSWDSWSWWTFSKQPVMLQFTVRIPASCNIPPGYDIVQLTYRPWGDNIKGDENYYAALGKWTKFDCIASGRWMQNPGDLDSKKPMAQIEGWTALLAKSVGNPDSGSSSTLGECTLMPTTTSYARYSEDYKSPGWNSTTDPEGNVNTTGTGKPINFTVGARMNNAVWPTESTNWFSESIGFRGGVDYFTLGIDLNGTNSDNDASERFTYNFEPVAGTPAPDVVFANMKAHDNASLTKDLKLGFQNRFMGKVCGKVVNRLNPWFELDDGSGQVVRVYMLNQGQPILTYGAQLDEWYSAWGLVEKPRWTQAATPYCMFTTPNHTTELN